MMRLIPVRVLVIDDDDAVCRKLSAWLTDAAFDVMTFTEAGAAMEYARKVYSPVALVDLRLPDADSTALMGELRKLWPQMRIVALAAFPEVPELIGAVRAGATDVLEKPVQPAALMIAMERQLAELGISARSEEEFNRRLGARLRAARTAANLTLNDVASACGLGAAQLSHIELGQTATSTWTLARICAALKTRLATIVDGP